MLFELAEASLFARLVNGLSEKNDLLPLPALPPPPLPSDELGPGNSAGSGGSGLVARLDVRLLPPAPTRLPVLKLDLLESGGVVSLLVSGDPVALLLLLNAAAVFRRPKESSKPVSTSSAASSPGVEGPALLLG